MKAVFFRHGPAVPRGTPGIEDADRALTPEGRKKTTRAARGLKALDLGIDAIYTSPLRRAVETADILAKTLKLRPEILEELGPGGPPRRLLAAAARLPATVPVLVGHEPLLSAAVLAAMGGTNRASLEIRKAGLALVDLDDGALELLLSGSALRRVGGG